MKNKFFWISSVVILSFIGTGFYIKIEEEKKEQREFLKKKDRIQQACLKLLPKDEGCIIVIEPKTGKVIALTNPDIGCRMDFPPGSTFKLVTSLAGLEEDIRERTLNLKVICKGFYIANNETLECSGVHGEVDLVKAIANSCNIFFFTLGEALGKKRVEITAKKIGFGERTGINIGDEKSGEILVKTNSQRFYVGEEGVSVTPIQMSIFVSAIANGGYFFRPQIIKDDMKTEKKINKKNLFSSFGLSFIRRGMREAVIYGTCSDVSLAGIEIAGKTGTAEIKNGGGKTHSWFLGFAPFENPEYAVVVFNIYGTGKLTSVPIAKKVFEICFSKLR